MAKKKTAQSKSPKKQAIKRDDIERLDEFTRAYAECALWASTEGENGETPLDKNHSINDITPYTISKMARDCKLFQLTAAWLIHGDKYKPNEWSNDARGGHDFWLTRNGHGTGFWDREWVDGSDGKELMAVCKVFGECNLIVNDDGQIESDY